ncbi:MAG: glycosyltransferase family 1 protein [Pseudomonadota bacterium]
MRRVGKVLTGVDRVELAYAQALLADPVPVFALIRAPLGYIVLDQAGVAQVVPVLAAAAVPPSVDHNKQAWRVARRNAIGRVPPALLRRALRTKLPAGFTYLNVGHSNLTHRVLSTMRATGSKITVLIHDVIPLDFPQFQREGTVAPFAAMIARVGRFADLLIYNSQDTRTCTQAHLTHPPQSIVAHLGTDAPTPIAEDLPEGLPPPAPYFLCIGTIEPRKNHAFLLDLWEEMGNAAPDLIIAGGRGWKNEDVFSRLDALPKSGPIREVSGLSDGALAALTAGSCGVVFPSHAEGFGLPLTQAVMQGVPVIANDLPVFREIVGEIPVYASVSDRYLWLNKIKELAATSPGVSKSPQFQPPGWDAHFKIVLRLT